MNKETIKALLQEIVDDAQEMGLYELPCDMTTVGVSENVLNETASPTAKAIELTNSYKQAIIAHNDKHIQHSRDIMKTYKAKLAAIKAGE